MPKKHQVTSKCKISAGSKVLLQKMKNGEGVPNLPPKSMVSTYLAVKNAGKKLL